MGYLRKGQLQPDKSYRYTYGKCNGKGTCGAVVCDWCYGLDTARLCEQIKMARGERYYGLLKALLSVIGKEIHDYAVSIVDRQGFIAGVDIAHVHLKFNLNMKATWEWLVETDVIHQPYEYFSRSKYKVRDAESAAIEKYREVAE